MTVPLSHAHSPTNPVAARPLPMLVEDIDDQGKGDGPLPITMFLRVRAILGYLY
jgi:hypothetical protein